MTEVLAIIQARGGSRRLPGKNIRPLLGKPLLGWTAEAARGAKSVTRTIISTEDEEIARIAAQFGVEVPFMRPVELASDTAKSIGLLRHALIWLEENEGYKPEVVVQLKPVNPLRTSKHIDECVKVYFDSPNIDAVITVMKAPAHPLKTWKFSDGMLEVFVPEEVYGIFEASKLPRQSLPEAYVQNSCVHVINPETILKKNSSIGTAVKGVIMEPEESINIDTEFDFEIAEMIMRKRNAA